MFWVKFKLKKEVENKIKNVIMNDKVDMCIFLYIF